MHVARQGGPRHRRRGAALARAANVATLSRQRLSVAPCGLARPNGLRPANKNQYGLNLNYYLKKVKIKKTGEERGAEGMGEEGRASVDP